MLAILKWGKLLILNFKRFIMYRFTKGLHYLQQCIYHICPNWVTIPNQHMLTIQSMWTHNYIIICSFYALHEGVLLRRGHIKPKAILSINMTFACEWFWGYRFLLIWSSKWGRLHLFLIWVKNSFFHTTRNGLTDKKSIIYTL